MFSPTEEKILKILGRRKMSIVDITSALHYRRKRPINAKIVVASMVRRINAKCAFHKLGWELNGEGKGRAGKTIWKDECSKTTKRRH